MDGLLDATEKSHIRRWISRDKHVKVELLYKATQDGYSVPSFHKHCDNMGPTITLAKNTPGYVFGGYTSKNWACSGGSYVIDPTAFLFKLRNAGGEEKRVKWCIKGGRNKCYLQL